jgi:hypothetical protein
MSKRQITLYVIALLSLMEVTPTRIQAWSFASNQYHPVPHLVNGTPIAISLAGDLDSDGNLEQLDLEDGGVTLSSSGKPIWQSPKTWRVAQASVTDLNHDHVPEIALVVWRPFQPWFVDRFLPHKGRLNAYQDEQGQSCHFILIGWRGDGYREIWASSALAYPILQFFTVDLNQDGRLELITLESEYRNPEQAQMLSVWSWNSFGFSLMARMHGNFQQASVILTQKNSPIILSEK